MSQEGLFLYLVYCISCFVALSQSSTVYIKKFITFINKQSVLFFGIRLANAAK